MKPITYGLEPYRPIPGQIVQTLPGKRPDATLLGQVLAVIAGFALAILVLAMEGSL